jgi:hypothetical protein
VENGKNLVIGKAAKPRCFENMDVTKFGVDWKSNQRDDDGMVRATGQKNDMQVEKSATVP